jgi:hypothetical protein
MYANLSNLTEIRGGVRNMVVNGMLKILCDFGKGYFEYKMYVLQYLRISHKTYIVYTGPNVTRHILYTVFGQIFSLNGFVNPHWDDSINTYFLIYPQNTYCKWDIYCMNTIVFE